MYRIDGTDEIDQIDGTDEIDQIDGTDETGQIGHLHIRLYR